MKLYWDRHTCNIYGDEHGEMYLTYGNYGLYLGKTEITIKTPLFECRWDEMFKMYTDSLYFRDAFKFYCRHKIWNEIDI